MFAYTLILSFLFVSTLITATPVPVPDPDPHPPHLPPYRYHRQPRPQLKHQIICPLPSLTETSTSKPPAPNITLTTYCTRNHLASCNAEGNLVLVNNPRLEDPGANSLGCGRPWCECRLGAGGRKWMGGLL